MNHSLLLLLKNIEDCGNTDTISPVKLIMNIAGPAITIFSALLALFTKTTRKTTKSTIVNDKVKKTQKEVFNHWAWWSLVGILLGGAISICAVIIDSQIKTIESCRTSFQDSVSQRKQDMLDTQLTQARDTLKHILSTAGSTASILKSSYADQLTALQQQKYQVQQTEAILHPLNPLKITITFQIRLSVEKNNELQQKIKDFYYANIGRVPRYFKMDHSGYGYSINCLQYSLIDTSQLTDAFINFRNDIIDYLPELNEVAFLTQKNQTVDNDASRVYGFFAHYPSILTGSKEVQTGQMENFYINFSYEAGSKFIDGAFTILPVNPSKADYGTGFKSLFQLKSGSIAFQVGYHKEKYHDDGTSLRFKYIYVECGTGTPELFSLEMDKQNKLDDDGNYTVPIDQLIWQTGPNTIK